VREREGEREGEIEGERGRKREREREREREKDRHEMKVYRITTCPKIGRARMSLRPWRSDQAPPITAYRMRGTKAQELKKTRNKLKICDR
jgi:hypothetical protein